MTDASSQTTEILAATPLSGETLSLIELCRRLQVDADWVTELVHHGAIDPTDGAVGTWEFEAITVVRVARAKRLRQDLELTPAGVAVVLELLDQISDLRIQLAQHGRE